MSQEIFEKCIKLYSAFDEAASLKIRDQDTKGYEFYPTHLGEENLVYVHDGKDYFFHSTQGAVREARMWFKSLRLHGIDLIYIYGIGLGYYYDELTKWLAEDTTRFAVFLENDLAVLHMLFKTERGYQVLKNENVFVHAISFVNGRIDINANKQLSSTLSAMYYKNSLLSALQIYYKKQEKVIINIKTQFYFSVNWEQILHADKETLLGNTTRNIISNILRVQDTALFHSMAGNFEQVPALICGAGPSISLEMDTLKTAKRKCLMIGSGTGTNVLNKNGIFPHFFVGLDPTVTQESRIRMNNSYIIPCFHKVRFSSGASKILSGDHVLLRGCESPFPIDWFERELGLDEGPDIKTGISSTTFAIEMAKSLGCNPIILIGLDLAYTDNKRYPEGMSIPFGTKNLQDEIYFKNENLLISKGYLGQEVLTKVDWLVESSVVTKLQLINPEFKILNATQGGLRIENVPNVALDEILNEMPLIDDMEGRLHALIWSKEIKVSSLKPLETVRLWESHIASFIEDLKRKHTSFISKKTVQDLFGSLEVFIEEGKKNPFFDTFYPGYREIQDGYLFLAKTRLQRNEVLEEKKEFEINAENLVETFFSFWRYVSEEHLNAVQLERKKFENELSLFNKKVKKESKTSKLLDEKEHSSKHLTSKTILKKNGSVLGKAQEKNGLYEGSCTYFGNALEPLSITLFKEGIMHGIQEKYYPSGKIYSQQRYEKGILEGLQVFFFEDGITKALLHYIHGLLTGRVLLYYPNGRVKREICFKDGFQHGFEKYYDELGQLLFISKYKKGKPYGDVFEYYSNGNLLRKTVFDNLGNRVSLQEFDLEGNEVKEVKETLPPSALKIYLNDMNKLTWAYGDERNRLFF